MNNSYTAVIKDEGNCWIGCIQEVPGVNCQENTYEALIDTLKITLYEALEFNKNQAISAAGDQFIEEQILV